MRTVADIASGQYDAADVFFLIAAILAVLAAVAYLIPVRTDVDAPNPNTRPWPWTASLVALSIAAGWFGLLLL